MFMGFSVVIVNAAELQLAPYLSRGYIFNNLDHLNFLHNENVVIKPIFFLRSHYTLETVGSPVSHVNRNGNNR